MKFTFRVLWTNTIKNRQEWVDVSEQDIAIFIAKKKVRESSYRSKLKILYNINAR